MCEMQASQRSVGEKVVRGWKGSKWLERSRVTPSKEAVNAFPAPCFPNTTRESPPLSAGPCLPARWPFPYQFANTAPHQGIPVSTAGVYPPKHGSPIFSQLFIVSQFLTLHLNTFHVIWYKCVPGLAQSAQRCSHLLDSYPERIAKYNEGLRYLNIGY